MTQLLHWLSWFECVIAVGIIIHGLCVLNKTSWKTRWWFMIPMLMLTIAAAAIVGVRLFPEEFARDISDNVFDVSHMALTISMGLVFATRRVSRGIDDRNRTNK